MGSKAQDEQGKLQDDREIAGKANLAAKVHDGTVPPDEGDALAAEADR